MRSKETTLGFLSMLIRITINAPGSSVAASEIAGFRSTLANWAIASSTFGSAGRCVHIRVESEPSKMSSISRLAFSHATRVLRLRSGRLRSSLASDLRHWCWNAEQQELFHLQEGWQPASHCELRNGWLCAVVGQAAEQGIWG